MALLPDDAIVMHPGPMNRGMEIAAEVADSARSTIVEQVANGVCRAHGRPLPAARRQRARMTTYLIKGAAAATAATPPTSWSTDGRIAAIGDRLSATGAEVVDAAGLIALPGLVDLHTHLREPGREDAETVETGSRAAALGGFTAVHAMANTDPVADTAGVVEQVWRLGQRGRPGRRAPGRRGDRRAGRRAAGRARRDGRLRRPGAGLLRRRALRDRPGADAPGAGVREGLRRGHRPARRGAAADRRRADARGRPSRPGSA